VQVFVIFSVGRSSIHWGAFFLGMILACYSLFIVPKLKLSQIIVYVTSSFNVSLCAAFVTVIFPSLNLMSLITGGIVSLLPGVAIANGIRALFDEDYQTGWTQILYALITALSISIGVGLGLLMINQLQGVSL
jgi:uncharacterized membrane protein YjjP (DUF1212 family)